MVWLLIGYMWLFIHRPFEIWPVLAAIRLERTYMLVVIACWLISGPSLPRRNRLHWCFLGFILVLVVSWLASPYPGAGRAQVEDYLKYAVFYVLMVTSVRDRRGLQIILAGHLLVMTLLMVHTLREYFCGNVWYAQGIIRMKSLGSTFSDYNDFAGLVVCALPFAWVLWHEWTTRWARLALVTYFAISAYCVVLTASRMGACGFVAAGAMAVAASSRRWLLLALCPFVLVAAWSILPEDHKERYLTLIDPSAGPNSAGASAGHWRFNGFEHGIGLWQERPLLGFGPQSTGTAIGTGMMPHNLYGQLLGELGTAGALAFGLMVLAVAGNLREARRIVRQMPDTSDLLAWRTVLAASAAYVLLLFMGWGFNFLLWHVWLWFGGFQVCALRCLKAQHNAAPNVECSPEGIPLPNTGTAWA